MDRDYNPILVDYIPASCVNASEDGMVLEWPLWWKCKGCPYWEKTFSGPNCTTGKCPFDNTNRLLVAATLLRIFVDENKTERYAKVVWVKEKEDCCRICVSFSS